MAAERTAILPPPHQHPAPVSHEQFILTSAVRLLQYPPGAARRMRAYRANRRAFLRQISNEAEALMPGCSGHMDAQGLCSTCLSNFFSHRSACAACSLPTARTFPLSLSPSNLPRHILYAGLMTLRELCAISATKGGQCVRLLEPRWIGTVPIHCLRCAVRDHRFAASICVLRADGWCPVCEDLVRVTNDLARAGMRTTRRAAFLINEGSGWALNDALRRGRERLKVLEAAQAPQALASAACPTPTSLSARSRTAGAVSLRRERRTHV